MSIYKRGEIYWYKFVLDGTVVRRSTKQCTAQKAQDAESRYKTKLTQEMEERRAACRRLECRDVLRCHECERFFNADKAVSRVSNIFCCIGCSSAWDKKHSMPTLAEFLHRTFLPYVNTKHRAKPLTLRYYVQGSAMLLKTEIADCRLDELNDQHAQLFIGHYATLSASGVNRGLRTMRRALNLAFQWGKLDKPVKVSLAQGEHQRDRVLSENESERYLNASPQPWKDCATILVDEGFRPSEVFTLQWQNVLLEHASGLIQITEGKSKAARRLLPMTPRVFELLRARREASGHPSEGWIFPSGARDGHFNGDAAKGQHKKALNESGVKPFEPYVLRHTALTRIAASCNDPFVVMKIAGHSSITMTQRYCHPQADAIERAFARLGEKQTATETELAKPCHTR